MINETTKTTTNLPQGKSIIEEFRLIREIAEISVSIASTHREQSVEARLINQDVRARLRMELETAKANLEKIKRLVEEMNPSG